MSLFDVQTEVFVGTNEDNLRTKICSYRSMGECYLEDGESIFTKTVIGKIEKDGPSSVCTLPAQNVVFGKNWVIFLEKPKEEDDTMMKLHPLHTPEWVYNSLKQTGTFDPQRSTGRTTAEALFTIQYAIKHPSEKVAIHDHFKDEYQVGVIKDIIVKLNLQKMKVGKVTTLGSYYLIFGDEDPEILG